MRVALVVAANKYTGAAAVAEHTCRALHAAGVDAELLFLAGRNLEQRLAGRDWAHPELVKERSWHKLRSNIEAIRRLAQRSDAVISHLPHDHFLCVAAGVHKTSHLVRNFRNLGHFRNDPYHHFLARRVLAAVLAHGGMFERLQRHAPGLPARALPVPLEDRFAAAHEPSPWRQRLGVPATARVVGMVGKLAADRGFELLLEATAALAEPAHLIVVGHGEAEPALTRLAQRLGIVERLHWAGYQEVELPCLYAAMDLVFFTGQGSDHGHRAISEAQGCARPVVAVDLPGVADLIDDGRTGRIVEATPSALAGAADELLSRPQQARLLADNGVAATASRRFEPCGRALAQFLDQVLTRGGESASDDDARPAFE